MPSSKSALKTTESSPGTTERENVAKPVISGLHSPTWTQAKNVPNEHIGERSKSSQVRYS